jgi:hypothetical protein
LPSQRLDFPAFLAHIARIRFMASRSAIVARGVFRFWSGESRAAHDPEKAFPGSDPGWEPAFGKIMSKHVKPQ